MKMMNYFNSDTRWRTSLVAFSLLLISIVGIAAEPNEPIAKVDNPIVAEGNVPELIYTRQAKLNSGLTEGPAVAADGSIYFTDMPFGADNGMILRYDPKSNQTTVFTDNSGKSNGLAFLRDGSAVSCDGADGGGRRLVRWNLKTKEGARRWQIAFKASDSTRPTILWSI